METIISPVCPLMSHPSLESERVSEVLFGEKIEILDQREGWYFVCQKRDGYSGWLEVKHISISALPKPNSVVSSPVTWVYSLPNMKSQPLFHIFMNSEIYTEPHDENFAKMAIPGTKNFGTGSETGYVFSKHLKTSANFKHVSKSKIRPSIQTAALFLNSPYLWGGKTRLGLDCSGLVQACSHFAGIECPRDSGQQLEHFSTTYEVSTQLEIRAGDLIFLPGHVAIALNNKNIIHANAFHMAVKIEEFRSLLGRISNKEKNGLKIVTQAFKLNNEQD